MKICSKCSVGNDDKAVFCTGCGAVLPNNREVNEQEFKSSLNTENPTSNEPPVQQADFTQPNTAYSQRSTYTQTASPFVQPVYSQPAQPQMPYSQQYGYINENMLPPEYRPVSVGQYIGYTLLFGLPIIGIIMLFVTAFGSDNSIGLRNYAKSFLIMYAVGFALSFIIMFFVGFLMASIGASPY